MRSAEGAILLARDGGFAWASQLAERLLEPLGSRWQHTLGVVRRAQSFGQLLDQQGSELLVAAAYLHDIGYAPELRDTMFHPLDAARFLRGGGRERLARLVAHHTGRLSRQKNAASNPRWPISPRSGRSSPRF